MVNNEVCNMLIISGMIYLGNSTVYYPNNCKGGDELCSIADKQINQIN